jgi:hypothetical protein
MAKHPKHSADWDEPSSHDETQEPEHDPLAKVHDEPRAGMVRVRCISKAGPFSDKKQLQFDEVVDVPKEVADALLEREFVELV